MKKFPGSLILALASIALAAVVVSGQASAPPPWAYGFSDAGPAPEAPPCPPDAKAMDCARPGEPHTATDVLYEVPGSDRTFNELQVYDNYNPADWHPEDHPPMPDIIAHGRESDKVRACGVCHYPNGMGKPENASPAGLPAGYILQQLEAFRNGTRRSAEPRKANNNEMIQIARHMTEAEMKEVAEYYASLERREWIRVVETETVPKTGHTQNGLFFPLPGDETEPLGNRIIEVPEAPELTLTLRAPRSGFVAYVPVGSVARGEELVTTGGGKVVQCALCHGPDLRGVADVPGIVDLPASYVVRQLYDIQAGTRESAMMQPMITTLDEDDMIAIAAYLASQ
jgi:cytochrome c553